MSEPLVIVGNGMAAARLVDELARVALGRYAIAVIGDEPRLAYNRVLLSSVLAGEVRASDILLKPAAWWSDRGHQRDPFPRRRSAMGKHLKRLSLAGIVGMVVVLAAAEARGASGFDQGGLTGGNVR